MDGTIESTNSKSEYTPSEISPHMHTDVRCPVWCRELQTLLEKAQTRAKGPWYKRLLRTTRDEETLKSISANLTDMLQRYQVRARYVRL